jgi:hypothetical protein
MSESAKQRLMRVSLTKRQTIQNLRDTLRITYKTSFPKLKWKEAEALADVHLNMIASQIERFKNVDSLSTD